MPAVARTCRTAAQRLLNDAGSGWLMIPCGFVLIPTSRDVVWKQWRLRSQNWNLPPANELISSLKRADRCVSSPTQLGRQQCPVNGADLVSLYTGADYPSGLVPSAADRSDLGHIRPPKSEGRRTHPQWRSNGCQGRQSPHLARTGHHNRGGEHDRGIHLRRHRCRQG